MRRIIAITLSLVLFSTAFGAELTEERSPVKIEYASPGDALKALRAKENVVFKKLQNDWFVAFDRQENTIWSFPGATHPAFPSVVKSVLVGGEVYFATKCSVSKSACDDLFKDATELSRIAFDFVKSW